MASGNRRFTVILVLLGIVACSAILAFFMLTEPAPVPDLAGGTAEPLPPAQPQPAPAGTQPAPATPRAPTTAEPARPVPSETLPKAEFVAELAKDRADEFARDRVVLPPTKLATDMFSFDVLPFDAPLAEFPIVLVWQKNREWYITRDTDLDGRLATPPATPSALSGRPRPPPGPPPGGGGGGGGGGPSPIPPSPESPSGL